MHAVIIVVVPLTSLLLVSPDSGSVPPDPSPRVSENSAAPESGEWLHSLEEAQQIATKRNLPMLVHFEASWCGACRRMDSQVLNTADVRAFLGQQIVGVRIDADRYRSLIDRYSITTLPTELVIAPDGAEGSRYVGAESHATYLARIQALAGSEQNRTVAKQESDSQDSESTRSCLIKRRDGTMVGLGGYSPVALTEEWKWHAGKEEFSVTFQGVDYFLQSADEEVQFKTDPQRFIPHLHGCDPVQLQRTNRAQTGVIELGAFYQGELFFFASLENRSRFQNNPTWYLDAAGRGPMSDGAEYPFLRSTIE